MNNLNWLRRLDAQLTGWCVWYTSGGGDPRGWYAVPAPSGTATAEAVRMPNRIHAQTPAGLRALARERYGWDDTCDTCGVLARECGHRQPERDGARTA